MPARLDRRQPLAEGGAGEPQRPADVAELAAGGVAAGEQAVAAAQQQRVGAGLAGGVEVEQPADQLADADVDPDPQPAAIPAGDQAVTPRPWVGSAEREVR